MSTNPVNPEIIDSDENIDPTADPEAYRKRKQPEGTDPQNVDEEDDLGDGRKDSNVA